MERLLPEVEIADLPLEVHGWTGFLDEYTHISGTDTREVDLPESLSALLVSESCNVGLTPVADETYPPLTRERLNWVGHNYLRSATHAAANARLVDFHTPLPLAQAWGGGEMASADGMRFVIPVSTINAAYNPRYFGRQRGSTLYSWMADTYTVFAQKLIPGTQRDSLHVLDGLLANQTGIQPEMVSTDTAGASEIVFALAWALGYRWAPRLADLPDQRLWRIDRDAHYGPLNGLARHRINTRLITEQLGRDLPAHRLAAGRHRHPLGDLAHPATRPQPLQPRPCPGRTRPGDQDPARARIRPRPGLPAHHPPPAQPR